MCPAFLDTLQLIPSFIGFSKQFHCQFQPASQDLASSFTVDHYFQPGADDVVAIVGSGLVTISPKCVVFIGDRLISFQFAASISTGMFTASSLLDLGFITFISYPMNPSSPYISQNTIFHKNSFQFLNFVKAFQLISQKKVCPLDQILSHPVQFYVVTSPLLVMSHRVTQTPIIPISWVSLDANKIISNGKSHQSCTIPLD